MDEIAEWSRAQQRVVALVADLDPERAATTVPACPDWTVRDLLSHMVGLGADVLAGDEPDDHNEEWTARQVDARRSRDVRALVAEWEVVAGPLQAWMAEHGTRPLGDVTIHEQDLRGALGEPGARDTPAIAVLRDRFVDRFAARLDPALPPIALVGEQWSWCSAGETSGAAVEVRAPDFDLARALVTRRSAAQLRSWTTRGDVEPYLDAFALLGALPEQDLTDG
ncbi:maleylpyruvate isomerase family mycothiol-dependent enzyme [Actinomycetospora straminea]|uniref:Maleylpyruvate isomerase family mycothiol-dependent enzyme n=1 Tax=Actinomycetospora straminea TaxID=663607 RepID=A0ABP9DWR4_9PSEU|nr:maleylpyruvate isomerase family mycothiol-dependent enzyme [Actinomycetospora straminea]MDD7934224.1 maleylpyruvate isomerase family mycothiol-dependent enzyme [Actinomycetospora straminea]